MKGKPAPDQQGADALALMAAQYSLCGANRRDLTLRQRRTHFGGPDHAAFKTLLMVVAAAMSLHAGWPDGAPSR